MQLLSVLSNLSPADPWVPSSFWGISASFSDSVDPQMVFGINSSHPRGVLRPSSKEGLDMAGELKSAWELALEKAKKMGEDDLPSLSPDQKKEIAEVRKVYEAKFAEVEILVQDKEKKDLELDRLRRERDRKVETVYERAKKKQ
jgi:hypothetical protein